MELYDTTVDDVRIVRDMFNGHPRKGSQGVRVMIKGWNGHSRPSGNSLWRLFDFVLYYLFDSKRVPWRCDSLLKTGSLQLQKLRGNSKTFQWIFLWGWLGGYISGCQLWYKWIMHIISFLNLQVSAPGFYTVHTSVLELYDISLHSIDISSVQKPAALWPGM